MRTKSRSQAKHRSTKRRTTRRNRKMKGGEHESCNKYKTQFMQLKIFLNKPFTQPIPALYIDFLTNTDINLEECDRVFSLNLRDNLAGRKILKRSNTYIFYDVQDNLENIFGKDDFPDSFMRFFGFKKKKKCTLEELMTSNDPSNECTPESLDLVNGSCGDPSFGDIKAHSDMSVENKNKYLNLLNAIETKFLTEPEPRYLDIVLGPSGWYYSEFEKKNNYTLSIQPLDKNYAKNSLETLFDKISSYDSLKNKKNILDNYFPLSYHNRPNNKEVLDKLVDMNNSGIHVRITNRMCGTCHPSLYYLVKHGIDYFVKPEQGYKMSNTPAIRRCFKPEANNAEE